MTAHDVDNQLLARLLSGQETGLDWASFSPQDWDQVISLSEREGVGPQLYWVLMHSEKISLLPRPGQDRLRAMFIATRLNNGQILQELERLTALFGQAGIPVVALKGICFALTIYPDIGLRPMLDLDLLVPRSRLQEALQIAYDSGYEKALPEATPGLDDLLNHAACLAKRRSPFTTLEVHHTLVGEQSFRHAVPVDWFWTQAEPLAGNSTGWQPGNLLMLTPTAQLLYACAHAMLQHGGRNASLRWLYDLDRLVRVHAERIDWGLLLDQARKFEWGSAVGTALSQIVSIFQTPVPPSILEELAAAVDGNIQRVSEMQSLPGTHTLEEYQKFRALDGRGRLKLFLGLAVPGPAYMRWRYGITRMWKLPFWYLYRWLGIFKDVIKTIWMLPVKTND